MDLMLIIVFCFCLFSLVLLMALMLFYAVCGLIDSTIEDYLKKWFNEDKEKE